MRFICLSFFLLVEKCTAWRNATIGHNYDTCTEINASIFFKSCVLILSLHVRYVIKVSNSLVNENEYYLCRFLTNHILQINVTFIP